MVLQLESADAFYLDIPNIIITSLIILKLENWLAIPEGKQKKGVIILDKKVDSENVTQDDSFFRHAAQK